MRYLDEVKRLNLPKDKFAIFGSGPIAIRGLREARDIDLIVKKDLWNELKNRFPLKKGKDDLLHAGNVDILFKWVNGVWDIDELIDTADVFEGIRFVKLEHVLRWKKARNEEKDRKDIKLIEEYLGSGKK